MSYVDPSALSILDLDDYDFVLVQKSDIFYCNVCLDKAPRVLNIPQPNVLPNPIKE